MGKSTILKQIFYKFEGQIDPEGQGQGHKICNNPRPQDNQYTALVSD